MNSTLVTLQYKVLVGFGSDDEVDVEVLLGPEGEFVRVRTRGHGERAALSLEQAVHFLEAMDAIHPDTIPDTPKVELITTNGMDIMGADPAEFTCRVQHEDGTRHTFKTSVPTPQRAPRQNAFISLIFLLALEAVRHPETILLLKSIYRHACVPPHPDLASPHPGGKSA